MKLLGDRIREVRLQLGLTQTSVASDVGCNKTHINRIECGHLKNFRIGTLTKIATALGVPISELLAGTEHDVPLTPRARKLLRAAESPVCVAS